MIVLNNQTQQRLLAPGLNNPGISSQSVNDLPDTNARFNRGNLKEWANEVRSVLHGRPMTTLDGGAAPPIRHTRSSSLGQATSSPNVLSMVLPTETSSVSDAPSQVSNQPTILAAAASNPQTPEVSAHSERDSRLGLNQNLNIDTLLQGNYGNCGFVAALKTLETSGLMEQVQRNIQMTPEGGIEVNFMNQAPGEAGSSFTIPPDWITTNADGQMLIRGSQITTADGTPAPPWIQALEVAGMATLATRELDPPMTMDEVMANPEAAFEKVSNYGYMGGEGLSRLLGRAGQYFEPGNPQHAQQLREQLIRFGETGQGAFTATGFPETMSRMERPEFSNSYDWAGGASAHEWSVDGVNVVNGQIASIRLIDPNSSEPFEVSEAEFFQAFGKVSGFAGTP